MQMLTSFYILKGRNNHPYETNKDLPDSVKKHLPEHAQDIYREAFNNSWEHIKALKMPH